MGPRLSHDDAESEMEKNENVINLFFVVLCFQRCSKKCNQLHLIFFLLIMFQVQFTCCDHSPLLLSQHCIVGFNFVAMSIEALVK